MQYGGHYHDRERPERERYDRDRPRKPLTKASETPAASGSAAPRRSSGPAQKPADNFTVTVKKSSIVTPDAPSGTIGSKIRQASTGSGDHEHEALLKEAMVSNMKITIKNTSLPEPPKPPSNNKSNQNSNNRNSKKEESSAAAADEPVDDSKSRRRRPVSSASNTNKPSTPSVAATETLPPAPVSTLADVTKASKLKADAVVASAKLNESKVAEEPLDRRVRKNRGASIKSVSTVPEKATEVSTEGAEENMAAAPSGGNKARVERKKPSPSASAPAPEKTVKDIAPFPAVESVVASVGKITIDDDDDHILNLVTSGRPAPIMTGPPAAAPSSPSHQVSQGTAPSPRAAAAVAALAAGKIPLPPGLVRSPTTP